MIRNPFKNLERIIHMELLQKVKNHPYPPEEYCADIEEILQRDYEAILTRINSLKTDSASEKEATWMAQAFQEKIDCLMGSMSVYLDQLGVSINDVAPSGSWHEVIIKIIEGLSSLIDALLYRLPDLIDPYRPMSEIMEAMLVKDHTHILYKELQKFPEGTATYEAYKLLLLPIEEADDYFYYFQIIYINTLKDEIFRVLKKERKDEEQAKLIRDILWKLNFNHPIYVSILRKEYIEYLDNSKGKERVKRCLEIRKDLRISKPLEGAFLYYMTPSIDKQLEGWLSAELSCTRALLVTEAIVATNPFVEFHVKTVFSLRQLAGILRLFIERGIILNEDRRELLRFFSTFFLPASGKRFSPAALTRCFDQHKDEIDFQQFKGLLGPNDKKS